MWLDRVIQSQVQPQAPPLCALPKGYLKPNLPSSLACPTLKQGHVGMIPLISRCNTNQYQYHSISYIYTSLYIYTYTYIYIYISFSMPGYAGVCRGRKVVSILLENGAEIEARRSRKAMLISSWSEVCQIQTVIVLLYRVVI